MLSAEVLSDAPNGAWQEDFKIYASEWCCEAVMPCTTSALGKT